MFGASNPVFSDPSIMVVAAELADVAVASLILDPFSYTLLRIEFRNNSKTQVL